MAAARPASQSSRHPRRSAAGRSSTAEPGASASTRSARTPLGDSLSSLAEQLVNRILQPLGLVVLSRERIQETLDEAAERGRVTRSDANELATLLIQRGRQQTEELLSDLERLLGRGRQQLDPSALRARSRDSMQRLVRGADRARRSVGVGSFPIMGYDRLTAREVQQRLSSLGPAELRKVREYERRHAGRKSVLAAIDKRLA